jgi:hypothetical protein
MVPVHILRLFFIKVNNKIITAEGNQGNATNAEETPPKLSLPDTTPGPSLEGGKVGDRPGPPNAWSPHICMQAAGSRPALLASERSRNRPALLASERSRSSAERENKPS